MSALGIVALMDGAPTECRNLAAVSWGGEQSGE